MATNDHNSFSKELRKLWLRMFFFVFVAGYYTYWHFKSLAKFAFRLGALSVVSFSTIHLGMEVIAHFTKGVWIDAVTLWIAVHMQDRPKLALLLTIVFVIAIASLITHNLREAMHRKHEYLFARRLCEYMITCRNLGQVSQAETIKHALELFHSVFKHAHIKHVCIHRLVGNTLTIDPTEVFPPESDESYYVSLHKATGIAGKVCDDKNIRYVPRVYFPFGTKRPYLPTAFFPHAIVFASQTRDVPGSSLKDLTLIHSRPETDVFEISENGRIPFKACLSVPMSSDPKACTAVLNFDFDTVDPLDEAGISIAAVLGLLLGEGLDRPAQGHSDDKKN